MSCEKCRCSFEGDTKLGQEQGAKLCSIRPLFFNKCLYPQRIENNAEKCPVNLHPDRYQYIDYSCYTR